MGVPPHEIAAVTFTNKAADEMRERVASRLGVRGAWIMTFHALCVRILRRHAEEAGLPRDFTIYDADDQVALLRKAIGALGLSEKMYPPRRVLSLVSMQKNGRAWSESDLREYRPAALNQIAAAYDDALRGSGAADFDDLLALSARLLEETDVLERDRALRFRYILVDEYQDTNRLQYRIVRALAAPHGNICVVGDEDQSIYSWRGADIRNILEFERDFPGASILRLEENYRSTQSILDAASGLVARNENRIGKTLRAMRPGGARVENLVARDEYDEALKVVADIRKGAGRVACLYRMNAQSRALEEALAAAGVSYQVVGAISFYARREIKDIVSYLRLIVNQSDDLAFRRVVNVPPRGIGEQSLVALELIARKESCSLFDALSHASVSELLSARTKAGLERFRTLLGALAARAKTLSTGDLINEVVSRTGYDALIDAEPSPIREDRLQNIEELRGAASDFDERDEGGLRGFLDRTFLLADADEVKEKARVLLMTLHAAKGLEFDTVFLVGMEEGLIPHSRALNDRGQMEEERRLCYVGMTRAKSRLVLTRAKTRSYYGDRRATEPSRFLSEIPEGAFSSATREHDDMASRGRRATNKETPDPRATALSSMKRYRPGQKVVHDSYGEGHVVRVEGSGEDAKLTVSFPSRGALRLLAKFAGLRPV